MSIHPSHRITVRVAIATAIAALVAVAGLLTTGNSVSHADACVAGPVPIMLKKNTKLTSPLRLRTYATCDDTPYSATARGYLYVAGHRTARLGTVTFTGVEIGAYTYQTFKISRKALNDTRAYARRRHHHTALLKFVGRASGSLNGREPHAYSSYNRVRI